MDGPLHIVRQEYTFVVAADDVLELFDANASRLALVPHARSWPRWPRAPGDSASPQQTSRRIFLRKGQRFYLEAHCSEGNGNDYCMVGVRVHAARVTPFDADWQAPQSGYAQLERQRIRLQLAGAQRVMQLATSGTTAAFRVALPDGRGGTLARSAPIAANASAAELSAALSPLLGVHCTVTSAPTADETLDLDTFDGADAADEVWPGVATNNHAWLTQYTALADVAEVADGAPSP